MTAITPLGDVGTQEGNTYSCGRGKGDAKRFLVITDGMRRRFAISTRRRYVTVATVKNAK